jgi:hypothetical protein
MFKKVVVPYLKAASLPCLLGFVAGFIISMVIGYFEAEPETPETEIAAIEVVTPTFDTKEALVDYALNAALNRDPQAMMATLSPETLQRLCDGDRERLLECVEVYTIAKTAQKEQRIREIMNDPEAKKQLIDELTAQGRFIQLDGKWYLTDAEFFQFFYQYRTAHQFAEAVANGNADAIWTLLTDASKANAISKYGNETDAKAALLNHSKGLFRYPDNATASEYEFLAGSCQRLLTLVGGRYFLNLDF